MLERLHVALDPGQVIGEQRFLLAAVRAGALDDGRRQAEAVGDLERQAAPGRPVIEPVGRRERLGIEAESGRRHALGGRCVGLERVVVRRGDHHRAAQAEVLDDRHGERAAFDRVGAGAGLVEQHQRRQSRARRPWRRCWRCGRRTCSGSAAIDCSSPMSAKTDLNTGICESSATGISRPAWAISGSRPAVFSATVLPPVFGSGDHQDVHRRKQRDVDGNRLGVGAAVLTLAGRIARLAVPGRAKVATHRRDQQRMAGGSQLEPAVLRQSWARRRRTRIEKRARACSTSSSAAASTVRSRSSARPRNASVSASRMRRTSSCFLLLERDDVVVDFDGAERLEKEAGAAARAAVHDAGDRRPVLGADDQHVAAVAIGDDLLLQVLRGVLAAQVRLERAAQPRALLPQAVADAAQLRRRIVQDLARRDRSCAGCRRSRARRRPSVRRWREGSGTTRAPVERRCAVLSTVLRKLASARSCSGSSGRPSTISPPSTLSSSGGA